MQSARQFLSQFTPLALSLSLLIFLTHLLTLCAPSLKRYVVLVPGRVAFSAWTCLTSSFVVLNPLEVMIDVVVLLFVGQVVEPVYGPLELLKYLAAVAAATGCATFAVAYTLFVIRHIVPALYIPISGFHGLLGAMLVAFKQVAPDHVLIFFDVVRIRAEWLPSVYVLLALPVGLLYRPLNFYPFLLFGTYFGWFYLRFFQIDRQTHLKGDPSPSFNFASFFPEVLRPAVNAVAVFSSKIFHIRNAEAEPYPSTTDRLVQSDPLDQARRRERGQKALEARLSGMNGRPKDEGTGGDAAV